CGLLSTISAADVEQGARIDRLRGVDDRGLAVERKAGAALNRPRLRLRRDVDVDEIGGRGLTLGHRGGAGCERETGNQHCDDRDLVHRSPRCRLTKRQWKYFFSNRGTRDIVAWKTVYRARRVSYHYRQLPARRILFS